jgi:hypothetical protein
VCTVPITSGLFELHKITYDDHDHISELK